MPLVIIDAIIYSKSCSSKPVTTDPVSGSYSAELSCASWVKLSPLWVPLMRYLGGKLGFWEFASLTLSARSKSTHLERPGLKEVRDLICKWSWWGAHFLLLIEGHTLCPRTVLLLPDIKIHSNLGQNFVVEDCLRVDVVNSNWKLDCLIIVTHSFGGLQTSSNVQYDLNQYINPNWSR